MGGQMRLAQTRVLAVSGPGLWEAALVGQGPRGVGWPLGSSFASLGI